MRLGPRYSHSHNLHETFKACLTIPAGLVVSYKHSNGAGERSEAVPPLFILSLLKIRTCLRVGPFFCFHGFPRRPVGRFGPYPVGHHQAGAAGQAGGVGDYRFNRRFAFSISIKLVQPELHNSSAASCIVIHPFSTSCLRESRILGMSYGRLFISSRSFPPLGVCPRDLRGGCCLQE